MQAALDLYHILSESDTDLRQPVGLEKQLLQGQSLDEDVGQSMLQLLQVSLMTWHAEVKFCPVASPLVPEKDGNIL